MAGQRITRDMFDAVVQEKMQRFRMSRDQAIAETVRECRAEGPSRMSTGSFDSLRDQERHSFRDPLARGFDAPMQRDAHPAYYREMGGRFSDSLLEKLSSADALLKERLYRQEMLTRELNLSSRTWDLERQSLPGPEYMRGFRDKEIGPSKNVYQPKGKGQSNPGVKGQGKTYDSPPGKAFDIPQGPRVMNVTDEDEQFCAPIAKWARFFKAKTDRDLLTQHKALFKAKTETCNMVVNCFKSLFPPFYTDLCFRSLKPISHPALRSPKIDNDLLTLLVETKTVSTKNDFFLAIKPFDKEVMILQQRLLSAATPLLLACNTYELKDDILTDPKQLISSLKSTVFLCRKSLVLLGQTFAKACAARQNNVMEVLGLSETDLKPSECPNYSDSFLFGNDFMAQLKAWLNKSGHKLTLTPRTQSTAPKGAVDEEESECATECE
ncbi:SURP and G-patch domain-containing protein 2-like, partial [Gastrophryne carolinensis]